MSDLFRQASARFSPCGTYRYHLARRWAPGPALVWVLLNPSVASADVNDATCERCERRAGEMGFPAVEIVNLFGLKSTDPRALAAHPDPIGPENDAAILTACRAAGLIVCGWGEYGRLHGRGAAVEALLRREGLPLSVLRLNSTGAPGHPLYVPYSSLPKPWEPA